MGSQQEKNQEQEIKNEAGRVRACYPQASPLEQAQSFQTAACWKQPDGRTQRGTAAAAAAAATVAARAAAYPAGSGAPRV